MSRALEEFPDSLVIFSTDSHDIALPLDARGETVWASQGQIAELFDVDQSGVSRHLRKLFQTGEVDERSNMQILHIASADRPVRYYNLDVILSVGYRVNSGRAIEFRRWATGVLRRYLLEGAAINEHRLDQLGSIVQVLSRSTDELISGTAEVLARYLPSLRVLRDYDEGAIAPVVGAEPSWTLTYDEARRVIDQIRAEFPEDRLFGGERGDALKELMVALLTSMLAAEAS